MFNTIILNPILNAIKNYSDRNAFCIADKIYTYSEFAQSISKIRKAMQSYDIKRNNIGLITNDDIETYASILAIWLEGHAYVPLHPKQPVERNLELISQSGIDLVIDSGNNLNLNVNTLHSSQLKFDELLLNPKSTSDNDLAYILFTSGSTGKPKGVPIMRSNLAAFMKSFWETGIKVEMNDRCLQCFDLTFDVSVQSFLVPLIAGACIYTIPHDQIKYSYVYGLLEDQKLTFCVIAPSMLRYLQPYFNEINIDSVRYCILTAEASPTRLIENWSKCIPNAEIYDFYGPTEATIYCTYYRFNKDSINKELNGMLSIGKAMHGMTAIIIDENKNILGANQKGELCISGNQLTPGYWNDQLKTDEVFFDYLMNGSVQRFYRTGDSCFFDNDGDIMYAGRIDFQVKIQGYRIELGEIEYHAREYLDNRNVVAIPFENITGNFEIALFFEGEIVDFNDLSDYLKTKLPIYMVPTKIINRNMFPLNANGKLDRNELKKYIN